jgi:hypothetical protein
MNTDFMTAAPKDTCSPRGGSSDRLGERAHPLRRHLAQPRGHSRLVGRQRRRARASPARARTGHVSHCVPEAGCPISTG